MPVPEVHNHPLSGTEIHLLIADQQQVPVFPNDPIENAVYLTPTMPGRKTEAWAQLPYEEKEDQLDRRIEFYRAVGIAGGRHLETIKAEHNASKTAESEHAHNAVTDELTGLKNRRGFLQDLEAAVKESANDPDPRLDLVFMDLDKFKNLNDTEGHSKGDELLRKISDKFQEMFRVRENDSLARIGGDEFVFLLNTKREGNSKRQVLTEDQAIEGFAKRIQEIVSMIAAEMGSSVSASLGVAKYITGETPAEFLDRADKAMYTTKRNKGVNR